MRILGLIGCVSLTTAGLGFQYTTAIVVGRRSVEKIPQTIAAATWFGVNPLAFQYLLLHRFGGGNLVGQFGGQCCGRNLLFGFNRLDLELIRLLSNTSFVVWSPVFYVVLFDQIFDLLTSLLSTLFRSHFLYIVAVIIIGETSVQHRIGRHRAHHWEDVIDMLLLLPLTVWGGWGQ